MNIGNFASFARRTLVSSALAGVTLAGTVGYASIASADERVIVTAPRPAVEVIAAPPAVEIIRPRPVVEVVRPRPVVEEIVRQPVVVGPRVVFEPGFYGYRGVYGRPGFYGYRGAEVFRGGFRR